MNQPTNQHTLSSFCLNPSKQQQQTHQLSSQIINEVNSIFLNFLFSLKLVVRILTVIKITFKKLVV